MSFLGPIPVFPDLPGLTFSIHKRPTYASLEFVAVSGRRVASPQQAFPLWEFELVYDHFVDQTQNSNPYQPHAGRADFTKLSSLFLGVGGKFGQFYFEDASDNSRLAQSFGYGDGITRDFLAVRTWGLPANFIIEPVGGIKSIYNVYVGGVLIAPGTYTYGSNVLTINPPPAAGAAVTVDFTYYYLCQFLEDQHDYEMFMMNLWSMRSLKMRSIKIDLPVGAIANIITDEVGILLTAG
jgi:hypothetical protein